MLEVSVTYGHHAFAIVIVVVDAEVRLTRLSEIMCFFRHILLSDDKRRATVAHRFVHL